LPLNVITEFVNRFLIFAKENPNLEFMVTRIGCGLAGFYEYEIAPMFKDAPPNCKLPYGVAWFY
jgi:hypothetical protein